MPSVSRDLQMLSAVCAGLLGCNSTINLQEAVLTVLSYRISKRQLKASTKMSCSLSRWTRIYRLIAQLAASVLAAYSDITFIAESWICRAPSAWVLLTPEASAPSKWNGQVWCPAALKRRALSISSFTCLMAPRYGPEQTW